ncbi:hypothetical protein H4219_001728 [Mycoemilia scoparia]|uniref:UV-stimulated scaffold protein A C-terminal domain-containing protein n=1 Tax=Mycoemilia scoparia TaxID=417184 RepID=A0A9W7ZZB5_9FUNG|nr:hypothetical protein H4219_001728 [Mycoemilia scoparia]
MTKSGSKTLDNDDIKVIYAARADKEAFTNFSTGNIRPSLQQQKKIDDEEKRRLFIRERRLKLVKKDFLTIKPLITGYFKVLVPDLDNLFQDLQSDDESDEFSDTDVDQHGQKQPDFPSEYDDSDEELESIMAVMNTNRHIIEIDLNPKTLYDIDDTDKDTSFQRERLSTNRTKLRVQFLPVIHNWQVVLTRIDCKELDVYKQLFESIEQVKKSVEDAMAKCIELSIEERKDIELPPIESLESIDKKKIGTRPIHASVPVSKEVEVDPTVVQGISKKISFIPKGLKASSNTNEEKEGGERSIEQKPKESIPIIDVLPGDFLEEGGELNAGFEVSHRIFGSSRDAPVISKEALRKLSRRYVKYSPSNTEPKRKCRHPLPNGKLCDIECILQCSQHGRVISRDEKGRPAVSGGFILPEDEKADPTIEEPSSDTKDAPEVVTVMGKGEKKSSGSKSKSSSGLQSKRKRPDSGISKLKKIINSPEALKKEAEMSLAFCRGEFPRKASNQAFMPNLSLPLTKESSISKKKMAKEEEISTLGNSHQLKLAPCEEAALSYDTLGSSIPTSGQQVMSYSAVLTSSPSRSYFIDQNVSACCTRFYIPLCLSTFRKESETISNQKDEFPGREYQNYHTSDNVETKYDEQKDFLEYNQHYPEKQPSPRKPKKSQRRISFSQDLDRMNCPVNSFYGNKAKPSRVIQKAKFRKLVKSMK